MDDAVHVLRKHSALMRSAPQHPGSGKAGQQRNAAPGKPAACSRQSARAHQEGPLLTRYRLSNSMPLGLGCEKSTGISTPPTSCGHSSMQSWMISGYLCSACHDGGLSSLQVCLPAAPGHHCFGLLADRQRASAAFRHTVCDDCMRGCPHSTVKPNIGCQTATLKTGCTGRHI